MTSLLEVDGLDVSYGDFQALFDVGLAVAEGRAVALVGANGAGKTTLLRTVAGALSPRAGRVRYDGADLSGLSPRERILRGIALVPEGRKLFSSLTAEENINVARVRESDWSLERLYEVFPVVAARRHHRASTLSGGEQQAVAIARALVSGPRLLLLDEISLGLAPRVVDDLYDTLGRLRAAGTTMVLVEQDLDRALSTCDDVACLLEGRIVLTAAATHTNREDVVASYFGTRA